MTDIEDKMAKVIQEWIGPLCIDCEKRPVYEGERCPECQFEHDVCRAEMIGEMDR